MSEMRSLKFPGDKEPREIVDAKAREAIEDLTSGADGASAYEIAVAHGFEGTEAEWLGSLKGKDAVVDATLTQAGQAADAAVVGARLSSLSEEIANLPTTPGADGQDGVGIQSVVQTTTSTEDGGSNIVTVTKTDGTTSTFEVRNGSKGSQGPAGTDGKDGADGQPGADGATPQRGTDYWTEEDIATIKSYVDDAILGGAW